MAATNLSLVKVTLKFWGRKIVWTVFPVTSCVCTYKCSTNITCAFDRAWRKWVGTQKENFKINNPRWNIMIRELNKMAKIYLTRKQRSKLSTSQRNQFMISS